MKTLKEAAAAVAATNDTVRDVTDSEVLYFCVPPDLMQDLRQALNRLGECDPEKHKAVIRCQGCGKIAPMMDYPGGWFKPDSWYERRDDNGRQVACSRECIQKVAANTGTTNVVLPI